MRKPTPKETQEIIDDMIRLYLIDPVKHDLLADRGDIKGNEDNTDQQQAEFILKNAEIVINETADNSNKRAIIFLECNCWGLLIDCGKGLRFIPEKLVERIYWGE